MSNRLINNRLRSVILAVKRSATISSDTSLGHQMKILNNTKKFNESLDLFDKHKEKNIKQLSSLVINQALKACAQIGDLQRGSNIHYLISSRIKNDSSVLASLIHFYSKFIQLSHSYFFICKVQCGEVKHAQSLFDKSTNKTLFIYGAMMKGKNYFYI
jgi:hypothetical protein